MQGEGVVKSGRTYCEIERLAEFGRGPSLESISLGQRDQSRVVAIAPPWNNRDCSHSGGREGDQLNRRSAQLSHLRLEWERGPTPGTWNVRPRAARSLVPDRTVCRRPDHVQPRIRSANCKMIAAAVAICRRKPAAGPSLVLNGDCRNRAKARRYRERIRALGLAPLRSALEERLRRFGSDARKPAMLEDLAASRRRWAALPVLDARSADEIIGGAASKDA